MPIITGNNTSGLVYASPTTDPLVPVETISITSGNYLGIANDNNVTPINTLLEHVEGASWTIDWYSQILTINSQLASQQASTSAAFQQYNKIQNLEVKVTSPLAQSQDPITKVFTYSGTALIYSLLIPNEGDMFVANIGDGQLAIFTVTATTKKSVFTKSAYEISYTITTTDPTYIQDLEAKTISRYVYRKDFLTYGQNPLVIQSDNDVLLGLGATYRTLALQYFPRFFNKEFKTFTAPGQQSAIYDPFLTDFIFKMFGSDDSPVLQELRRLNVSDDPVMIQDNIWTALMNQEPLYLQTGFTKVGLVSTSMFTYDPFFNSIRYTGIDFCVYPQNPVLNITNTDTWTVKTLSPVTLVEVPGGSSTITPPIAGSTTPTYDIYPVLNDTYYVLSSNFYNASANQSNLENAVSAFLAGQAIDLILLSRISKEFMTWGLLEQYYYVPILLLLIRASVRSYQG